MTTLKDGIETSCAVATLPVRPAVIGSMPVQFCIYTMNDEYIFLDVDGKRFIVKRRLDREGIKSV